MNINTRHANCILSSQETVSVVTRLNCSIMMRKPVMLTISSCSGSTFDATVLTNQIQYMDLCGPTS